MDHELLGGRREQQRGGSLVTRNNKASRTFTQTRTFSDQHFIFPLISHLTGAKFPALLHLHAYRASHSVGSDPRSSPQAYKHTIGDQVQPQSYLPRLVGMVWANPHPTHAHTRLVWVWAEHLGARIHDSVLIATLTHPTSPGDMVDGNVRPAYIVRISSSLWTSKPGTTTGLIVESLILDNT